MTMPEKLHALAYCIDNDSPEDAAGHLCDLLEWCRVRIHPSVGEPFASLAEMAEYYGKNPVVPESRP